MKLYFLRHAIAAERGDPKYKDDSLRPLTAPGRKKMQGAAFGMKNLNLSFDVILSSPYLRARQTAEIVLQTYKLKNKKLHLTNHLLPPATIEDLLKEVRAHFPKAKNILLVGHEPHLTEMISALLESERHLFIDFKKGGLCCLDLPQSSGKRSARYSSNEGAPWAASRP